MNTTKKNIVHKLSLDTKMKQNEASFFLDSFIEILKDSLLIDSYTCKITKFGTFTKKTTPQRTGRNPKTKELYIITKRKKIVFSASNFIKGVLK